MNYLQVFALCRGLNIGWSTTISRFIEATAEISDLTYQFFSFECMVSNYDSEDLVYLKLILVCFLPFFVIAVITIIFLSFRLLKFKNLLDKLILCVIFTCYLLQPFIIQNCLQIFSCKETDENQFNIQSFLITECYTKKYYGYVDFIFNLT